MIAYRAHGPRGTRWEGVHLRIVAHDLEPKGLQDTYRIAVQVMEGSKPIAESPIAEGHLSGMAFLHWISQSIREGWDITQCLVHIAKQDADHLHDFMAMLNGRKAA